jgi:hypothetical protein
MIRLVRSLDAAFDLATDLGAVIARAITAAAYVRAQVAAAIAADMAQRARPTLTELAQRLSRPGRPISKPRAHQLLDLAEHGPGVVKRPKTRSIPAEPGESASS